MILYNARGAHLLPVVPAADDLLRRQGQLRGICMYIYIYIYIYREREREAPVVVIGTWHLLHMCSSPGKYLFRHRHSNISHFDAVCFPSGVT